MTHMLTRLWETLTGYERVTLLETERMLVLTRGRFAAILGPGEHRIKRADTLREVHNIDRFRFASPYDRALFRTRLDLAEANVIRRREETNATRSLLNTAKVMAENPVMLRLKELEALETIAGKVERLTVHNGTAGLMEDIARLRE